jgi:hypothetical protein
MASKTQRIAVQDALDHEATMAVPNRTEMAMGFPIMWIAVQDNLAPRQREAVHKPAWRVVPTAIVMAHQTVSTNVQA